MIRHDTFFASFKGIRGIPQHFHIMSLDMLAKYRKFGKPTFLITGFAAEFDWTEVIKVIAKQYNEILIDEQIKGMDRETKIMYLKRNLVTATRHIDYIFQQLWDKVILGGIHLLGQIINYDDRDEFQKRGTKHFHGTVHVKGAPLIDKDDDEVGTQFINKFITCELPDDPELCNKLRENLLIIRLLLAKKERC